jgi:hypothetical protein
MSSNKPAKLGGAHMKNAWCPTLAAFLFLRLGWDADTLNHPFAFVAPSIDSMI